MKLYLIPTLLNMEMYFVHDISSESCSEYSEILSEIITDLILGTEKKAKIRGYKKRKVGPT